MHFAVSIGHTLDGIGSGAIGYLNESVCNREIGDLVRKYLEQLGHKVTFCRIDKTSQKSEDLAYRVNMANQANVDLFVEIHCNCGGGRGTEVYAMSSKGKEYAQKVVDSIASLGYVNRGVKDGGWLYVVKHTDAPAILVECFFIDSKEDTDRYNPDNIARAIVKGLTGQTVANKEVERIVDNMEVRDVQHVCNVLGIKDYEGKPLAEDNSHGKRTESARVKLKEILTYIYK